ncbi:MAG: sensor histidine kinase KdpD [Marmoricola sp.]|nr:sensor histidine kinase KdpD [Marmoricola sp.]
MWGYLLALVLPVLTSLVLAGLRHSLNLSSDVLLFLLMTVVAALVGGVWPGLVSAVAGATFLNYFFTPPLHTLTVDEPNNALSLGVFVLVATLVSWVVNLAARRTNEAASAAAEARALAETDRTRTALLAAVGHDLRTPLAAAKAAVSTLRSVDLDLVAADREELVATADESLDRLTGLIENLLDMSRLQAGAMAVTLRPVALEEVVARALDDLGPPSAEVVVDLAPDVPDVEADPGLLERVMVNLVANALRFSPSGRPPLLTAVRQGTHVLVGVVDHGPGIPANQHDQVFLPFQRLGDTDNTTGVGLGLALSRGLTEAMGGTLEPGTTPGGGLTMLLRLRAHTSPDAQPEPGLRERAAGELP